METTLVFLVLGLGPGAAYAGLGLGLLFTYRGSGVLNLAHGSMAMYPTYVYAELRAEGDLVLPGLPGSLHLADLGALASLLIALVVAGFIGVLAHALVFGPLRRRGAPPLASVVAAVGLHIALEAVVIRRFDTTPRLVPSVLPEQTLSIGGTPVPADRLYLAAAVVGLAVLAAVVQNRTRFGLASRAAAENETAVALLGHSPDRLGLSNWVIGSVLAGLFGILLAPMTGLTPGAYSFLIVPALATAVAGGFASTGITTGVGLALGAAQAQLTRVDLPVEWLGPQVLKEVLPFVALATVLGWRGALLPGRGARRAERLPAAGAPAHPVRLIVGLIVAGTLALMATDGSYRVAIVVTMIGALMCLSLVVLVGFAGQISLAQMSFAGVAGFTVSHLTTEAGVPFPIAPLLAALAAGACGVVVGVPALRARGVSFAVMTLGGALAANELVFRNLSNGVLQSNTVASPRLGGIDLAATGIDGTPRVGFGLLVLAVLACAAASIVVLRRSSLGRQLLAVRANERAAAASGVNVAFAKLTVFGLSAALAGLAGALEAYHFGIVSAGGFGVGASFAILASAYLGGIGTVMGALVGGLIVSGGIVPTLLDRFLHIGNYQVLLSGIAMIAMAVNNPEGVASAVRTRLDRRRQRR